MLKSVLWFPVSRILQLEEEYIQNVCSDIIAIKPDVVFTEKGVSGEIIIDHYDVIKMFAWNWVKRLMKSF